MNSGGDDEFISAMQRAKLRAETFSDHQAAIAGRETGRILPRVGQNASEAESQSAKRFSDTVEILTNLQTMLQDPEYAKAYTRVKGLLEEAERLTESALIEAELALEEAVTRSVKLPDGRAIFKDKDGNVRSEDGAIIDVALIAGIDWPNDAPSFEEFESRKQRVDDFRKDQVNLGGIRDRLEDEDNPYTKQELDEIQKSLEEQNAAFKKTEDAPEISTDEPAPITKIALDVPEL